MANANPPKKAQAFSGSFCLSDMAVAGRFKVNPTIAAGDFKIDKDQGGFANFATLPTVSPAGGVEVFFTLSATEMTADIVTLTGIDQTTPGEWADWNLTILTTT